MTAGKARERIDGLQESITSRRHRLEQLRTRLDRSDVPDERLMAAKSRLERRIEQEEEQLEKLVRLLDLQDEDEPEESNDFEAEEELEDLHRSFEEIRQNVAQLQTRFDNNPEVPRDLDGRLSTCESRISRREAVDSELFARVMSLQTALDQERQAARRLARRLKDQEQNMEALREAVEDAFVTNVDLAQRVEELAELSAPDVSVAEEAAVQPWMSVTEELRTSLAEAKSRLEQLHQFAQDSFQSSAREREELRSQQEETSRRLSLGLTQAEAESRFASVSESQAAVTSAYLARLESLETKVPASVDLSEVWQRLESLEAAAPPSVDLSEVWQRLESMEKTQSAALAAASVVPSPAAIAPEPIAPSAPVEPSTLPPAPTPRFEMGTDARNRAVFASPNEIVGRKIAVFGTRPSRFR